jgi:FkbM family methyltransferase
MYTFIYKVPKEGVVGIRWQNDSRVSIASSRCPNLTQLIVNNAVKKLAYYEYVFLRLWSRLLLGKKRRNALIRREGINFDRLMLKHFMNRSTGFIKPLNEKEGFILYNGFRCIVPLDDTGVASEVKTVYMKPKKGDIVVDVGAHYGFYTLYASNLVGADGMVLSFEPHPDNYKGLLINLQLNGIKNVKAFNMALGEFDGKTRLYIRSHSGGHSTFLRSKYYINAELAKLDIVVERLNFKKVDLIKIDTEGAELNVLDGASKVIERFKPNLTMAAYHFQGEATELEGWLKKYPFYTAKRAHNNFLHATPRTRKI